MTTITMAKYYELLEDRAEQLAIDVDDLKEQLTSAEAEIEELLATNKHLAEIIQALGGVINDLKPRF